MYCKCIQSTQLYTCYLLLYYAKTVLILLCKTTPSMHYPQLPHPSPVKFTLHPSSAKSALDISPISDYTLVSMISDLLYMVENSFIYIII